MYLPLFTVKFFTSLLLNQLMYDYYNSMLYSLFTTILINDCM